MGLIATIAERAAFRALCLLVRVGGAARRRRTFVYYNYPDFERKAEALADLLRERGIAAEVRSGTSPSTRAMLKAGPDLWIGYWNELAPYFMPRRYVFLNAEPLGVDKWRNNAEWWRSMASAIEVWDYSRANEAPVLAAGAAFRFVPFGYAPYYERVFRRHTEGKQLEQDIDALFVGEVTERRRLVLAELEKAGMNVRVVGRDSPAYGEELDCLYARARIVLSIFNFTDPELHIADFARIDHLLSNRIFVLHEQPAGSSSDPRFGQFVATCGYDEIPKACAHYLAHPEERAACATRSHEWFKSEYHLDRFIPYESVREWAR